MRKDQVYIGMLVNYEQCEALVIEMKEKTVVVMRLTDHAIEECSYCELKSLPSRKLYNNSIREANSKYNGKFVKNDDKVFDFVDGSKVWFTSDTHFSHAKIMEFCNRPFVDVADMNEKLIERWNSVIKPDDVVFHLGDFCWGGSEEWKNILNRLNGHIHLVIGNHDVKNLRQGYMQYFDSVSFQKQITIEGRKVYLNHYPFLTYGGIYRKDTDAVWQLFGHVHSHNGGGGADAGRLQYLLPTQYDVGVDNNDYIPINFHQVREIIESQIAKARS